MPRTGDYAAWINGHIIPRYLSIVGIHERLDALEKYDLIVWSNTGYPSLKRYLKSSKGQIPSDIWIDILVSLGKERLGYPPTKTPVPATSHHQSQQQRNWVGIDLSPLAAKLVNSRLQKDMGLFFDIHHREDIPKRTDLGDRTHKHMLYGRQEGVCGGCQVMFPFRNMTVDHIVAQSKGGSDHMDNLQLLCGACNSTKGARSQEEFIVRLTEQGPRS